MLNQTGLDLAKNRLWHQQQIFPLPCFRMAAAAASLLGFGATVGPPPSSPASPGAAAAFELLRPLAKTAPAPAVSGESRDDRLLENFLATLGRFGEVKIKGNLGKA